MVNDSTESRKDFSQRVTTLDILLKNMRKPQYQSDQTIAAFLDNSFNEKVGLLKQRYGVTKDYIRLKNDYHLFKGIEGS